MNASIIFDAFDEREPIVRKEIQDVLKIRNLNTLNQMVSYPPFEINKKNTNVLEFLELIKYLVYSDYNIEQSISQLLDILDSLGLKKEEIIQYSEYYKGKRYAEFRETVRKLSIMKLHLINMLFENSSYF